MPAPCWFEHGSHGSQTAAPFAYDILAQCLKYDPANKPIYQPKKGVARPRRSGRRPGPRRPQ